MKYLGWILPVLGAFLLLQAEFYVHMMRVTEALDGYEERIIMLNKHELEIKYLKKQMEVCCEKNLSSDFNVFDDCYFCYGYDDWQIREGLSGTGHKP